MPSNRLSTLANWLAPSRCHAIIFDFLNTLVTVDVDTPSPSQMLAAEGLQVTSECASRWDPEFYNGTETPTYHSSPGYVEWRRDLLVSLVRASGGDDSQAEQLPRRIMALDGQWTVKALAGTIPLLRNLRERGYRIGICSNWDVPLDDHLVQAGIPDPDAVISSAVVGARKPHSRPFLETLRLLSVSPERAVFVGDRWDTDVLGARAAGLKVIWLTKQAQPQDTDVVVLQTLAQLREVVRRAH